ncbi:hypothetical protein BO71DRAFT_397588 [Aspergillus ellipticus CBS 707.79]|uniref:Luciferase domain-containing protein n=1 Tax=Aspergillus ellipticus CBS 707.79 TaxID=1448320 RepID=A0A319EWK6_9EURO|nr:hypothetical protein BO71DRAFT_397588 [Aspergillus ellipticus CBS 707.79]
MQPPPQSLLPIPIPISTHSLDTPILLTLFLLTLPTLLLTHLIRKDYHAFLALGPGGTPSTPLGYVRICLLRLFIIRDPFNPPSIPPTLHPRSGLLSPTSLPMRSGPRPTVAGIAPQRQMSQKSGVAMYDILSREIQSLVACHPGELYEGTSCFEKHSTGIFCTVSGGGGISSGLGPTPFGGMEGGDISSAVMMSHRRTCNGEVCHAHPSDGSLHLTLHPADVKLVIERGWAQRHPLTRESWWWCFLRTVPTGFVMVYAPRDREELEIVLEIIRAAAWWVSGEELQREKMGKGVAGVRGRQMVM